MKCPEDATGVYPNCTCHNIKDRHDSKHNKCGHCPLDSDQNSIYPNCICTDGMSIFDVYSNRCGKCKPGKGTFPNCVEISYGGYEPSPINLDCLIACVG